MAGYRRRLPEIDELFEVLLASGMDISSLLVSRLTVLRMGQGAEQLVITNSSHTATNLELEKVCHERFMSIYTSLSLTALARDKILFLHRK